MATATIERETNKPEPETMDAEFAAWQANPNGWRLAGLPRLTPELGAKACDYFLTIGELSEAWTNGIGNAFNEIEVAEIREALWQYVAVSDDCPAAWKVGITEAFGLDVKPPAPAEPTAADTIKKLEAELIDARRRLSEYDEAEQRCAAAEADVEDAKATLKECKEIFDGRVADLRKAIRSKETKYALPFDNHPGDPTDVAAPVSAETAPPANLNAWRELPVDALCDDSLPEHLTEKIVEKLTDAGIQTLGQLYDRVQNEWWHRDVKGVGKDKKATIEDALTAYRGRWDALAGVVAEPVPVENDADYAAITSDISTPELLDLIARAAHVQVNPADLSGWNSAVRQRVMEWCDAMLAVEVGMMHLADVPERPEVLDRICGNKAQRNGANGKVKKTGADDAKLYDPDAFVAEIEAIIERIDALEVCDFTVSTCETLHGIQDTVEKTGVVTMAQRTAVENISVAVAKWEK